LRDKLTVNVKNVKSEFGDKIYISRQGQKLRFIENESEVTELLTRYGFKKIVMENYSYQEQIDICHNARYIIGPHGAGLTNILFMKKNSTILELSAKNDNDFFNGFYILANMLGHNYLYQKCAFGNNSIACDSHKSSLNVNLARLESNIKIMLNNKNV
jgi:capsular polysaccharide biosynthesis protein